MTLKPLLLISSVSLFITACTSSTPPSYPTTTVVQSDTLTLLNQAHNTWQGTPYQLGGTTRSGMDCSGLVYIVFFEQFNTPLPRTTEALADIGYKISPKQLNPGDLVFFKTGFSSRHVGIYLDNGRFLHASTSKGVMISHLNDYYCRDRFWQARRIDNI